ncbi:GGDEF domain-containing protein, partial [Ochrobactrum sp. SFR4]|uniref:GGDEF domain-containing protein n=1 Tax=Ochrobactrum sp. SFR4 TaxID=2717368 RepID=UPI001C8CCF03
MPVLTGFPISVYIFIQNAKLKKTTDDLTEANRLLQIRADTDSMTGLLNRNAFLDTIKQLNKTSRQSALLVIDADNFKNINDV